MKQNVRSELGRVASDSNQSLPFTLEGLEAQGQPQDGMDQLGRLIASRMLVAMIRAECVRSLEGRKQAEWTLRDKAIVLTSAMVDLCDRNLTNAARDFKLFAAECPWSGQEHAAVVAKAREITQIHGTNCYDMLQAKIVDKYGIPFMPVEQLNSVQN